jgi:hypothetical protein
MTGDDDKNLPAEKPKKRGGKFVKGGHNPHAFKKGGPSPNPGGRGKTSKEFQERAQAVAFKLLERAEGIADDPNASNNDIIKALHEVGDRAWGRAVQPVFNEHNLGDSTLTGTTALLRAAMAADDAREVGNVRPALPNAGGMSALLAAAKAAPLDGFVPRPEPSPVVSAPAEAPAPTLESIEARPLPEVKRNPTPDEQIEALKRLNTGHLPSPCRPSSPDPNLPGGQVPAKDWFKPDPVGESPQSQQEIIRLGRVPGSRGIRRV